MHKFDNKMEELASGVFAETTYSGVNVGAVVTSTGVIAIDAPSYPADTRDWLMRLHHLSPYPIHYLILTDYHGDRILNTRRFNTRLITHQLTAARLAQYEKRFPSALIESLVTRKGSGNSREFSNGPAERPFLSISHDLTIYKNNKSIQIIAAPGPTSANLLIYLPESHILFTGDILVANTHPLLQEPVSQKWLETLNQLENWPHPLKAIVPGRGPICGPQTITQVKTYLTEMRACIKAHIAEDKPQAQIAAYIPKFLDMFPTHNLPLSWLQQQIRQSLEHVYTEVKLTQEQPESAVA
ncbi:MAG: MBL fold metallo-hydrolase [Chloroflexi bacterium]|nr:MAG: MBL fold metallo-hydrolase [Chloroflexota bacterium]